MTLSFQSLKYILESIYKCDKDQEKKQTRNSI